MLRVNNVALTHLGGYTFHSLKKRMTAFQGEKLTPMDRPIRAESEKAMINIMYRSLFILIATLATSACQPAQEPEGTDSEQCAAGTTEKLSWCASLTAVYVSVTDECDTDPTPLPQGYEYFACELIEGEFGAIPDCIPQVLANECLGAWSTEDCNSDFMNLEPCRQVHEICVSDEIDCEWLPD